MNPRAGIFSFTVGVPGTGARTRIPVILGEPPPAMAPPMGPPPSPPAAVDALDPLVLFTRLLRFFDHASSFAAIGGADSFAMTVYADRVECAEEAAKIWAASRNLPIHTSEHNGRKTVSVTDLEHRELFRVFFASRDVVGLDIRGELARADRSAK